MKIRSGRGNRDVDRTNCQRQGAWIRGLLVLAVGICTALCLAHPAHGMLSIGSRCDPDAELIVSATSTAVIPPQSTPDIPDYSPPATSSRRPPLYQVPLALRPEDHFYLTRPIQSGYRNWATPSYRFGSTLLGQAPLHTGVDMAVSLGTPIVAAGSGNVIWTGFGFYRGVYDPDDNYGLAIAIRHDFGYRGQNLFTVYGHLSSVAVWPGQRVEAGQIIGTVGSTGRSTGPHLHFEVRLGDDIYSKVRNPELWMTIPEGWGVLAGRLQDSWGRSLHEQRLRIVSLETSTYCDVWTYAADTLGVDPNYRENFAISDLPAGRYRLETVYSWHTYTAEIDLLPGQTTFIAFRGTAGFIVEPDLETDTWTPPIP